MKTMNDGTKNDLHDSSSKDNYFPTLMVGSLGIIAIMMLGGIYSTYWVIEAMTDLAKYYFQFFL